jgi:hypothetical protein
MKRFVIVLLAIALATFAFAEGFCFKGYLNGGFSEPGMIGTDIGAYRHNSTGHGFDVKLGARKSLKDFYVMPEALPLEVQFGLGFQHQFDKLNNGVVTNPNSKMTAFTFNADILYPVDQVVCVPIIDISPFIGLQYDFQMYEQGYNVHMIGVQVGLMIDYDLSDRMALELVMGNPFNFDFTPIIATPFTSQAYINLGLSYVFEL